MSKLNLKSGLLFATSTVMLVLFALLSLAPVSTSAATATVTDINNPDSYTCAQSGYINFETMADGFNLSANAINGVHFTTTNGYTWLVGDFATGQYNGKYPNGSYTSQGTHWAWLGTSQGSGRIDFVDGPASYISLLVSGLTPVRLDAYDSAGHLLVTAGPTPANTDTGHMSELKISHDTKDISYIIVHDSGNYFLVDSICTNAPGIPPIFPEIVHAAMSVFGTPYQWGGKGYDFSPGSRSFVTTEKITTSGYNFYDGDAKFGIGLDCSGLNMWAYNRTFYGDQTIQWDKDTCEERDGVTKCPIFYPLADDQWRSNSTKQLGAPKIDTLKVGDLLFFNTKNKKDRSGGPIMDHTAMYVGLFEFFGNDYNVIHASGWSETNAVVPAWYDEETGTLTTDSLLDPNNSPKAQKLKVTGWGKVLDARLDAWVITHSPVHISVTDPDGITVSRTNSLAGENGLTNEVPGMSYMIADVDGSAEDTVAIAELKRGAYFIDVHPKPGALSTDTYSLEVRFPDLGKETLWFAEDIAVTPHTFVIETIENRPVVSTEMDLQIKPFDPVPCINPKSKSDIPMVLFGSSGTPAELISTATIRLDHDSDRTTEGSKPDKIALEDINKDGYKDIVLHFRTQILNTNGILQDEKNVFITALTHDAHPIIGRDTIHLVGGAQCGK